MLSQPYFEAFWSKEGIKIQSQSKSKFNDAFEGQFSGIHFYTFFKDSNGL